MRLIMWTIITAVIMVVGFITTSSPIDGARLEIFILLEIFYVAGFITAYLVL